MLTPIKTGFDVRGGPAGKNNNTLVKILVLHDFGESLFCFPEAGRAKPGQPKLSCQVGTQCGRGRGRNFSTESFPSPKKRH